MEYELNKPSVRLSYIDSLKGFAMLCVVLGHVVDGYINSNMYPDNTSQMIVIYKIIYSFHMELFFLISGLLYSHAYIKQGNVDKSRIRNKILNLIGVYIIFSITMGVFKIVFGRYTNTDVTVNDLLLIPIKTISPYWYLYVLVVFYALISIINTDSLLNKYRFIFAIALTLSILSSFLNFTDWFELRRICNHFLFFYAGILIDKNVFGNLNGFKKNSLIGGVLLVTCVSYGMNISAVSGIGIALTVSLCLLFIFKKIPMLSKQGLLTYLGKHSMELYVFHCFFTAGLRPVFRMLGITRSCLAGIILNMVISILGSLIVVKFCKKLKIYDLLFLPYTSLSKYLKAKGR